MDIIGKKQLCRMEYQLLAWAFMVPAWYHRPESAQPQGNVQPILPDMEAA